MKKVISFCLWGSNKKYCYGAFKNAELAQRIYPDWKCWFYCRSDTDWQTLDLLRQFWNTKVILVDQLGSWTGMFDRFLPAIDPEIDVMISRDCDSRLSLREKAAVDEWINSSYGFHTMNDHPWHSVPILGGCWGIKRDTIPAFEFLMESWRKEDRYQTDQEFLTQIIWPKVQGNVLRHDDGFYTHLWGGKPFPLARNGLEFVGEIFDENDLPNREHRDILHNVLRKRK